ncbi:MAG TPA: PAS domain S-box protein [Pyrinomonadaceae bacterium]
MLPVFLADTNRTAAGIVAAFNAYNASPPVAQQQAARTTAAINPVSLALLKARLPGGAFAVPSPTTASGLTPVSGLPLFREDQYNGNADAKLSDVPPRLRATVQAVYSSGIAIGGVAFFGGGLIGQLYGWRWAFYLLGFPPAGKPKPGNAGMGSEKHSGLKLCVSNASRARLRALRFRRLRGPALYAFNLAFLRFVLLSSIRIGRQSLCEPPPGCKISMFIEDSESQSSTEDRFRAILEQSPFSIQIMSADGRIIRVNRAWEELWGVTLEQLDGYNILEDEQLVRKGIMPYIRRGFAGEALELPPVLYDPDATIPNITRHKEPQRWTKAVIYPIKDGAGRVREVVLMHEDITARILAEEKMRVSEARYRTLFETTLDGIMVVDEQGRYVEVNESLCRLLKAPREKLIGSHFSEHMVAERLHDAEKAFNTLRETGVFAGDFPVRAADGSTVEVEWTSRAHFLPGLHVCFARDVTERKRTEEALRESESRYQRAAESGRVGIWDLNLESNELYLAPNLKAMLGYRDEELRNHLDDWCNLVHPDDKEKALAATRAHLEGNAPRYEVEVRRRHKEGHYLWFLAQGTALKDGSGKAYRLTGSDTDITPRKQMEGELRRNEARYRSLLENANDIIYSHDLEGNYLSINRAGSEATGYTRAEILGGLNIANVVAPEHLERAKQMTMLKLEDPTPTIYEVDIIARDGRRLTLEVSTRISFEEGRPVVEGVARDVTERRRAEQERARLAAQVEEQRKHLQAMVSSVPGVVWEAWGEPDASHQRIDFVSDYVEKMLGYSVEEWLSTPNFWLSIVHPEDKEHAAREATRTYTSGRRGTNQFRWIAKDGRIVWVESQSVAICDAEGRPIGMRGVTMDISERKQKEANERFLAEASTALASSLDYETTLRTVARLAVPHFADWCSVDIAGEDGTLSRLAVAHIDPEKVAWAHELQKRYPPDPAQPLGVYNVMRTGRSEFYPDIPDELLVQGAIDEEHLDVMRRIGFRSVMLVPLKTRDKTLGVLSFVNTEASRHHTQEELALAEDLAYRAALAVDNARLYRAEQQTRLAAERTSGLLMRLQAVSTSLSQALTPQQVSTAVIEQGVNSLGAHAGTVVLLTNHASELEIVATVGFPQEVSERWQRFSVAQRVPIAAAVREKKPVIIESLAPWKERYPSLGPLASVTGSKALIAFPLVVEGRTIGALGLSFPQEQSFSEDDLTFMLALAQQCAQALERARLYETEKQLRTEAETANRIKDEFLATVSHELRTPLTAIVGWASLLRNNKLDEDATARAMETIERNAKAQTQIIEDLLDVSRIITGKLRLEARSTELDSIIRTALEALRPAAETKELTVTAELDAAAGTVWGDPARLQQVMWNLLSNAVKFTPKGGQVEVKLRRADSQVEIVVSDTGQGISAEFLPFVFDRFRQADGSTTRAYGGLGLGLAIVRHLVEMHGGTVRAESGGKGLGSTFIITLPLMAAQAVQMDSTPPSTEPPEESSPVNCAPSLDDVRILIVDDEEDARIILTLIVERCGASVRAVRSAREALAALREFKPHILVSDIGMPDEDGYTLIKKVRALKPEEGGKIPAIALTAYAREEDRMRALLAGFQVHIPKPVNPAELIAVVGGLTEIRRRE